MPLIEVFTNLSRFSPASVNICLTGTEVVKGAAQ